MKIKEIKEMVLDKLFKMLQDKSYVIGAVAGTISVAIPEWIYKNKEWTANHMILVGILIGVLLMDQMTGRKLAQKSPVLIKNTTTMIDSLMRDFTMFVIVGMSYGFDYLLGTGSILFVFMTVSLIYHNFYSFLANALLLGWGKNYPFWLFKWLDNELKAKAKKYFPDSEIETELDEKLKEDSSQN